MNSGVPGIVKMTSRGLPYRLYGSDRSARWWIPSEPRLRAVGAQIYKPTTLGGKLRRLAMANGVAGTQVLLDEATIATWQETLAGVVGLEDARLALYASGEPPVTKTSVLILDPDGRAHAFAKIAGPKVHAALENEHEVLLRLGNEVSLAGHVPRSWGLVRRGEQLAVVTTLAPDAAGPSRFGAAHQAILSELDRAFGDDRRLADTALVKSARARQDALHQDLSPAWSKRMDAAVWELENEYADCPIRSTLAHRDFAPWNTATDGRGLFVFDWETAAWNYPVGLDTLQFHFVTSLFQGRGVLPGEVVRWLGTLNLAPSRHCAVGLFLAFLVDVAFTYHKLRVLAGEHEDDTMLTRVAQLLDARAAWGAV